MVLIRNVASSWPTEAALRGVGWGSGGIWLGHAGEAGSASAGSDEEKAAGPGWKGHAHVHFLSSVVKRTEHSQTF